MPVLILTTSAAMIRAWCVVVLATSSLALPQPASQTESVLSVANSLKANPSAWALNCDRLSRAKSARASLDGGVPFVYLHLPKVRAACHVRVSDP